MNELARRLSDLIKAHGPIDVARFMTLATSHPAFGYYPANATIGAEGDFLTAPEASQMFGELIGAWVAAVWVMAERPAPVRLVELGPGRGTMLGDLLRATRQVEGFQQALTLHLVETSPRLRAVQHAAIDHHSVFWHDTIDDVPTDGFRIVIGNEFLDALPIRQVQRLNGEWHDRLIGVDEDGSLTFVMDPRPAGVASVLPKFSDEVGDGAVLELAPAREAFVDQLCHQLSPSGGVVLLIDYGDLELSPGDTLQAISKHTKVDPLASPGEADVTACVTFAPLIEIAQRQGITAWGPVAQGPFLQRLGLARRLQLLCEQASERQAASLRRGADRLASPDEMGGLFKVVALTSSSDIPPGFHEAERRKPCG